MSLIRASQMHRFLSQAYLHYRGQVLTRISWLLLPLVQLLLVILASINAVLRISDNAHHSVDVAVGAAIGIVAAAWLVYLLYLSTIKDALSKGLHCTSMALRYLVREHQHKRRRLRKAEDYRYRHLPEHLSWRDQWTCNVYE